MSKSSGSASNDTKEPVWGETPLANRELTPSEKQKHKMLQQAMAPVEVTCLHDIKQLVQHLVRTGGGSEVRVDVQLDWVNEDNTTSYEKVSGVSKDSSLFSLLIDGMDVVKKQIDASQKIKQSIDDAAIAGVDVTALNTNLWDLDRMKFNVDDLIVRKLGGKRNGLRVRWEFKEEAYEFDPYTKKLFKSEMKVNEPKSDSKSVDQSASSG